MANASDFLGTGGGGGEVLVLLDEQIFTSSGTWTKPADNSGNVTAGTNKKVFVRAIGGGGSGGTREADSSSTVGGGGGGGGVEAWFAIADVGATETVTVGAGGLANPVTGRGNNGGDSSFGSLCGATGGKRGWESSNSEASYISEGHGGQGWFSVDALPSSRAGAGGDGGHVAYDQSNSLVQQRGGSSSLGGGGGGAGSGNFATNGGAGSGGAGGSGGDAFGVEAGLAGTSCPAGQVLGGGGGGANAYDTFDDGGAGGLYGGGSGAGNGDRAGHGAQGAILVQVWGTV